MKRLAALAITMTLMGAQDRGVRSVTAVRHWTLGDVTRVAVEVSADFKYHTDRLQNPDRVYFDIMNARPRIGEHPLFSESLDDPRVKRLRVAETTPGVTRIVLDLAGSVQVTTTQLANPDRLMIEVRSAGGSATPVSPVTPPKPPPTAPAAAPKATPEPPNSGPMLPPTRQPKAVAAPPDLASAEMVVAEPSKTQLGQPPATSDGASELGTSESAAAGGATDSTARPSVAPPAGPADGSTATRHDSPSPFSSAPPSTPSSAPSSAAAPPASTSANSSETGKALRYDTSPGSPAPVAPAVANTLAETGRAARHTTNGDSSLVRELGLKISRVVIDPGHGGHDEGTRGATLVEKDLVLDVAKRVGKLIEDKMGAEVIYTRTDDTFIPLEGRTALANEKKADLFLSIHANSSPVTRITGMETYYLNFADTKDAMDLAARENATARESIFELRDMVQKITMHDKAEESKEFASRIQSALYAFSSREFPANRNRGVKKAPFVVLIGAQMPSVLAEIGFLSNPREEALLKRNDYRQRLAEALFRGVQRYADSLSHFQVAQQTQNRP
ncbi:MAG TPA: N-acetylmuramoyl-L-alanine amidase [Bryobacteraceae bacterium]|nr:N-acetylmuramoyl-L-alanine amidase [Bryobacteraceae bacterium]